VRLHNIGVHRLLHGSSPEKWAQLRGFLDGSDDADTRAFADLVRARYREQAPQVRAAIEAIVGAETTPETARDVARVLGVKGSSLTSHFFRARLTSVGRLLQGWWLLAARREMARNPDASVLDVAEALGFSSPQAFGRTVRSVFRCSATAWFAQMDVAAVERWVLAQCPNVAVAAPRLTLSRSMPARVSRTKKRRAA
jgi:AraC-like DNA-binding protein